MPPTERGKACRTIFTATSTATRNRPHLESTHEKQFPTFWPVAAPRGAVGHHGRRPRRGRNSFLAASVFARRTGRHCASAKPNREGSATSSETGRLRRYRRESEACRYFSAS